MNLLDHPVGWWRDTAQRLLVERQDQRAIPLLKDRVRTAANPLCRLHALWTLAGLNALDARDPGPGRSRSSSPPFASMPSARRRLPTAPANGLPTRDDHRPGRGSLDPGPPSGRARPGQRGPVDPTAVRALAGLASRDAADPWMRLAILSGLGESALPFLREWVTTRPDLLDAATPEQLRLLSDAAAILGARRREQELVAFLELVETTGRRTIRSTRSARVGSLALLAGLGEGMERSGPPLHAWLAEPGERRGGPRFRSSTPLWPAARVLALSAQPVEHRQLALEALVRGRPELAVPVVARLLRADQPARLQSAAARAVGRVGGAELTSRILDSWSELALGTRRELLGAMLASPASAAALVEALENQTVAAAELDPASRDALRHLADPAVRKRAEAILARSAPADRSSVVARYQAALSAPGRRRPRRRRSSPRTARPATSTRARATASGPTSRASPAARRPCS